ncbi:MAG: hypothetical protein ACRCTW_10115 [Lactococcus garvieae]|nr:hypothetical protein [Plesiomonas shigelloides]
MTLTAVQSSHVTPPSRQERLLGGLKEFADQSYTRVVAKMYGFRISNGWDKTILNIADDINSSDLKYQNCTIDNLEKLVDRVITTANHHYTIYSVSKADADNIRGVLSSLVNVNQNSIYSNVYPETVDLQSHTIGVLPGHYLCKVVHLSDGFACIFASVVEEPIKGHRALSSQMIKSQYFHTVFVPHNESRIEVRISDNAPMRYHQRHAIAINNKFIDLISQHKVSFQSKMINFYNCISSYFDDVNSYRVAHAILTTGQDSKDAELKNLRSKDYCARTQKVVDTKNQFNYVCRAVLLKRKYAGNVSDEIDISFFPHKNDWEKQLCSSVQLKKPDTSTALSAIISDILSRC